MIDNTNNLASNSPMTEQPQRKKKVLESLVQKQPIKNVYKCLITTTLGVVIILGSLFSSIVMNNAWSDSVWGLAVGVGLLFAPDEIITKLKKFIK